MLAEDQKELVRQLMILHLTTQIGAMRIHELQLTMAIVAVHQTRLIGINRARKNHEELHLL